MIEFEPLEGGVYKISHEVDHGGYVLFRRGEIVKIERIDPDPAAPEFRFLVNCSRSKNPVRLKAEDFECPHEYQYLPDGTSLCRICGKNITALGTELPYLSRECARCGCALDVNALVCGKCGLATPYSVRQNIIAEEAQSTKNRPIAEPDYGHTGADFDGTGAGVVFNIFSELFDHFHH